MVTKQEIVEDILAVIHLHSTAGTNHSQAVIDAFTKLNLNLEGLAIGYIDAKSAKYAPEFIQDVTKYLADYNEQHLAWLRKQIPDADSEEYKKYMRESQLENSNIYSNMRGPRSQERTAGAIDNIKLSHKAFEQCIWLKQLKQHYGTRVDMEQFSIILPLYCSAKAFKDWLNTALDKTMIEKCRLSETDNKITFADEESLSSLLAYFLSKFPDSGIEKRVGDGLLKAGNYSDAALQALMQKYHASPRDFDLFIEAVDKLEAQPVFERGEELDLKKPETVGSEDYRQMAINIFDMAPNMRDRWKYVDDSIVRVKNPTNNTLISYLLALRNALGLQFGSPSSVIPPTHGSLVEEGGSDDEFDDESCAVAEVMSEYTDDANEYDTSDEDQSTSEDPNQKSPDFVAKGKRPADRIETLTEAANAEANNDTLEHQKKRAKTIGSQLNGLSHREQIDSVIQSLDAQIAQIQEEIRRGDTSREHCLVEVNSDLAKLHAAKITLNKEAKCAPPGFSNT